MESGANAASRRWKLLTSQNVNGDFVIQQSTTQTGSTFADILGFNASGAATFSSSVTAGGNINIYSSVIPSIIALTPTFWGYSSSYPVVMLGSSASASTVSIGYNPSGNANGSFTGNGDEILFRNGAKFTTPNSANNSYYLNHLVLKDGNVGIGTASPDTFSYGGARKFLTLSATATNEEPFLQLIANGVGNSIIDFGNATIRRASIIGFDGSSLAFFTNGTNSGTSLLERMRITSGGAMFNRASTAGHTAFIGAIGPGNVGDRYLHVRINTIQNMMVWIKIFGYAYTVGNIEGLSGCYIDGGTGAATQAYQNGSIVAQYQNSNYLEIVVDTVSTSTTNRWGSISFMGGTDSIATIQPLEIMAYSWTSTTTRVY